MTAIPGADEVSPRIVISPMPVDRLVLSPMIFCGQGRSITHKRLVISPMGPARYPSPGAGFEKRNTRARFLNFIKSLTLAEATRSRRPSPNALKQSPKGINSAHAPEPLQKARPPKRARKGPRGNCAPPCHAPASPAHRTRPPTGPAGPQTAYAVRLPQLNQSRGGALSVPRCPETVKTARLRH